ncbi:MAG: ABC transporter ATP-binding protein [Clostridia bacterium]|nr:ABC transporter ATP-binding protein [Clostridia bacterium]
MKIELKNICKKYEETEAVRDVSLTIEDGEMMALLGPSGCGKSTLLRMIAGLIEVTYGNIFFDERDVTNLACQKRNTSMVFQSYALFPHMNVYENIAFGLKVRKYSKKLIVQKVEEMLEKVELSGVGNRKVQELSGGQRQRVALARALITEPDILLFDEPLSNLDEKLRVSMRQSIRKLQQKLGITSIYVTHDQEEAMSIADRITVMNRGEILQTDTPDRIYRNPKNDFVAEFVGQTNFFEIAGSGILILGRDINFESSETERLAMIRPENIYFAGDKDAGEEGIVTFKEELGIITRYQIDISGKEIRIDVLSSKTQDSYNIGERVYVSFDKENIVTVDKI